MKRISSKKDLNPATLRMATLPVGCEKLHTEGLWVPLVIVNKNIYVLPGVPKIMERMMEAAKDRFGSGLPRERRIIYTKMSEGQLAQPLENIAANHPEAAIGSYPRTQKSDKFNVRITVEGDIAATVDTVAGEVAEAINGVFDVEQL